MDLDQSQITSEMEEDAWLRYVESEFETSLTDEQTATFLRIYAHTMKRVEEIIREAIG